MFLLISPGLLYLPARFAQVQGVQLPGEDPGDLMAASVDGTGTAPGRHVGWDRERYGEGVGRLEVFFFFFR